MKRGEFYICILICQLLWYSSGATNLHSSESAIIDSFLVFHPVHMSFTNIEYNESEKKFEILFKLFVDDFDRILEIKYGENLNLTGGKWLKGHKKKIQMYILEHFKLVINGKDKTKSSLKFLDKKVKEQSIWLYYHFSFTGKSNNFDVHNSLMTDLYPDQTNLLVFCYNKEQKAIKFTNKKNNEELTF